MQDGFDLYLHGFIVADDGKWCVVQQGMNGGSKRARRYHWLSEGLDSFVDAPHAAIEGRAGGKIVNLADRRAAASRLRAARAARSSWGRKAGARGGGPGPAARRPRWLCRCCRTSICRTIMTSGPMT